ncbi:MAG: CPBP family intramembrane glutamic endopeptidase [Jaaginema sp. PMC 1079.18]|nr:CPBP family intramembrane glutamic endopeptidase [Jaaginema sp. PMC 1080.18]MEC4853299.1 CPBP family intramembrane glutamic endopeptidase [Jaaginema sp. PMC 1079.18]MEC4868125.1 CPBP family intramembrane glutamic endopeptidase [Jaaginema sp. PMC 1078.18]
METVVNSPISQSILTWANESAIARLLLFGIGWIGLWLPLALPLAKLLKWDFRSLPKEEQKLPLIGSLYGLAPAILWGMTAIESISFAQYGVELQGALWRSLGVGFAIAVGGLTLVFALETGLGWLTWKRDRIRALISLFLPILAVGLGIGGIEELIFRGFVFGELNLDYPISIAAITSSIIFALLHLVWEQKETLPQLPGLFLMGLVLVLAYQIDNRSIGLAWGLHAGWIWGLTCLNSSGAIAYNENASPWWIGWYQQPLAGIMGIFCLGATACVLWFLR